MQYYIIASNPRTGSHLLRSILTQNKCGNPIEMFLDFVFNPEEQTLRDFREKTTKGDFSGMVVQVHHIKLVSHVVEKLIGRVPQNIVDGLNILFPNPKFIYLHRIDKVRQAISFLKARRTQNYSHFPSHEKKEVDYGEYSQNDIMEHMRRLCIWDSFWLNFFSRNGIEPLTISYEELVKNKLLTVVKVFEFLGHTPDMVKMNSDMMPIRQYDAVSQEWYDKYYADEIVFT